MKPRALRLWIALTAICAGAAGCASWQQASTGDGAALDARYAAACDELRSDELPRKASKRDVTQRSTSTNRGSAKKVLQARSGDGGVASQAHPAQLAAHEVRVHECEPVTWQKRVACGHPVTCGQDSASVECETESCP